MAVEHDEGAVTYSLGGEGLGQFLERGQGEAKLRPLVGKVGLEVEERRAREVALVVVGAAAFGDVPAVWAGLEVGGAVKNAQAWGTHAARQFLG